MCFLNHFLQFTLQSLAQSQSGLLFSNKELFLFDFGERKVLALSKTSSCLWGTVLGLITATLDLKWF